MARRLLRERRLTDEEVECHRHIREQVAAELADIQRRAQSARPRILKTVVKRPKQK